MWQSRRCIWGCQDEIKLCFFLPPLMPLSFVRFAPYHQLPLLECTLAVKIFQKASPNRVLPDVFHPEIVQIFYETGNLHKTAHLRCSRIFPLTGSIRQAECLATIRVQKGGCNLQRFVRGRGCHIYHFMALRAESIGGLFKGTSASWRWMNDTCASQLNRNRIRSVESHRPSS